VGSVGLGLSISQAIVESHGGTIEVTSVPSRGSTFTVHFPV
jgi:signal transduction histidine kinase